jgi:flagellar assembly factor FliW
VSAGAVTSGPGVARGTGAGAPIAFPRGLPGFPGPRTLTLRPLARPGGPAWLLIASGPPPLALPVQPITAPSDIFPGADLPAAAEAAGIALADLLVLLVLRPAADGRPASVNLRAPVLVDARARVGVQVILADRYPVAAPLAAVARATDAPETVARAAA